MGERYGTRRGPDERSPNSPRRTTYLVDPEGRIARAYRVSGVAEHPRTVLDDVTALAAG